VKPCDHHLRQVILLAERMIKLADVGDDDREDTGCGILFGMLRDSGYNTAFEGKWHVAPYLPTSWYGYETYHQEDGHMTANGEAFDPNGLNAAHKHLPLPTFVRVVNLENHPG